MKMFSQSQHKSGTVSTRLGCGVLATLFICGFLPTQAAAKPGPAPTPPTLTQPIFPLSQIHAGQHGTAYTVFEGTKPEAIGVEVLGVLRDAIGPGKSMILVRLDGSHSEFTGVAAGMSGSPVYIDNKLAGAIAFRIGQFTKQPIAGVTPIQQMLEVFSSNTCDTGTAEATAVSAVSIHTDASGSEANPDTLQPIETPLTFSGLSPAAMNLFRQHAPGLGLTPVSGLGGAAPDETDTAPIVPGSAISAIIVSGDFNMAATCTVTYVDPTRLLACGHPITRFGNVALPMAKSVVVTTIASSLNPMKVINTTQTVGEFTQDRTSAILGVFGKTAPMVPVTLAIEGTPAARTYHFAIAEHPKLTSAAVLAILYQAMQDANAYSDPATYRIHGSIAVAGYPPIRINDWVAPTKQQPASLGAAVAVAQRFDSIFNNARQMPQIQSVSLTIDTLPGERTLDLADASLLNPVIHPGDTITVEAILHPYRAPQRVVRLQAKLPSTLMPGPMRLLISDGDTLDHTLHLAPDPSGSPLNLTATIAKLNQMHSSDRLYVTLLAPVPQATLQGHDLPAVPLSMANVLQPDESSGTFRLEGETAVPLASTNLDAVLRGSRIITMNVQP
jgi:hypothetical protein